MTPSCANTAWDLSRTYIARAGKACEHREAYNLHTVSFIPVRRTAVFSQVITTDAERVRIVLSDILLLLKLSTFMDIDGPFASYCVSAEQILPDITEFIILKNCIVMY